jgi:hypothetical protein
VTEIPEHLLKRSRERRGALSGGEGAVEGGTEASSAAEGGATSVPAVAKAPAPAKAAAPAPRVEAPKPLRPEVIAAKTRKKIPFWAMPVLGLLPVWAFIYAESMSPPEIRLTGPLAEGETLFGQCSSCHGDTGGGGIGYQLSEGEVIKSFATFESQLEFISKGNVAFAGKPYGTGRHIGGQRGAAGTMPAWLNTEPGGQFTKAEVIAVVCHERFTLQGLTADNPGNRAAEYAKWCAPEAPEFIAAEEAG